MKVVDIFSIIKKIKAFFFLSDLFAMLADIRPVAGRRLALETSGHVELIYVGLMSVARHHRGKVDDEALGFLGSLHERVVHRPQHALDAAVGRGLRVLGDGLADRAFYRAVF